jgi:LPS O-antigen subunit length determinant protein (WzzB/FepE family)
MLNENILILRRLFKARKHILAVTLSVAVISFIVCLLLKPAYKSTAYVYPANLVVYSEESTTEQLLQFMQSNEVRAYVCKKMNLAAHYHLDTNNRLAAFYLDATYDAKINVNKTKYESIEIKVEDSSPDTARLIVNAIVDGSNWLIEKEHREKYWETVKNALVYLNYKKHEVDSSQKILTEMSEKYGLMNVGVQLKEAARNQYKLWSEGKKNGELENLVENMKKLGVEQGKMAVYFDDQLRGWAWANNDYQKKLSEYHHKTTFTVMASRATRPVVANWPRKSIIVPVSAAAAFVLCCLYFVFIERIKSVYEQIAS